MGRLRFSMSKEEKIAVAFGRMLSDFTLDLEAIGKYMAIANPYLIYSRTIEVLEATKYNKDVAEYREVSKHYGQQRFFE